MIRAKLYFLRQFSAEQSDAFLVYAKDLNSMGRAIKQNENKRTSQEERHHSRSCTCCITFPVIDRSLHMSRKFFSRIFMCNRSHKVRASECILRPPKMEAWEINSTNHAKMFEHLACTLSKHAQFQMQLR